MFCLVFTISKYKRVHYCYCCWKVFHFAAAAAIAVTAVFFFIAHYYYSLLSYFFASSHKHSQNDATIFRLACFLSLLLFPTFLSSIVTIVHNWLYFTRYDILRSSVLYIHVEYWTSDEFTNTCLEIQFTFFSFRRFLDIYFDFCPNNEAFAEPLSCYVLRDLKCLINFYFVTYIRLAIRFPSRNRMKGIEDESHNDRRFIDKQSPNFLPFHL